MNCKKPTLKAASALPAAAATARWCATVSGILMLEIEVQDAVLGITVLKFSGRITMGPESAGIEVLVRKLLGENRKKLVFDLSGVNYIDSTGLGILTFCSATMQAATRSAPLPACIVAEQNVRMPSPV